VTTFDKTIEEAWQQWMDDAGFEKGEESDN